MLMNVKELENIKIEVTLKDLTELQEMSRLYFFGVTERESLQRENSDLRRQLEELRAKSLG